MAEPGKRLSAIQSTTAEPKEYYDHFIGSLLDDYCYGNIRTEAAIVFAIQSIPLGVSRILDLGCGIGWSSWELSRHFPKATVTGLDLSKNLVEHAAKLHKSSRVQFACQNLLEWEPGQCGSFDAIVMLDVYEHIPVAERKALHIRLRELLNERGRIVLTCPSKEYQDFLRVKFPEKLQPVDEDVTEDNAQELADDTKTFVTEFRRKQIWNRNDYNHILLCRSRNSGLPVPDQATLLGPTERCTKVEETLRLKPVSKGVYCQAGQSDRIVIATPSIADIANSAIGNLLFSLPFDVVLLTGHDFEFDINGRWLFQRGSLKRILDKIIHRVDKGAYRRFRVLKRAEWLRQVEPKLVISFHDAHAIGLCESAMSSNVPVVRCLTSAQSDWHADPVERQYFDSFLANSNVIYDDSSLYQGHSHNSSQNRFILDPSNSNELAAFLERAIQNG